MGGGVKVSQLFLFISQSYWPALPFLASDFLCPFFVKSKSKNHPSFIFIYESSQINFRKVYIYIGV